MEDGSSDVTVRISAGDSGRNGHSSSAEIGQVSEILRARSFAKMRNMSASELDGCERS